MDEVAVFSDKDNADEGLTRRSIHKRTNSPLLDNAQQQTHVRLFFMFSLPIMFSHFRNNTQRVIFQDHFSSQALDGQARVLYVFRVVA